MTNKGETHVYQKAGILEHSQLPYRDNHQVAGNVEHLRWNLPLVIFSYYNKDKNNKEVTVLIVFFALII